MLDLGGGVKPSVPPARRPAGLHYEGLDVSPDELQRAPRGSYDEIVVADATRRLPELEGRFDLVLSWLVLEHVKPLADALHHVHAYLRPGGSLVAQAAGAFTLPAITNRLVPRRAALWILGRAQDRDPESVFPAHYDCCWHDGLARLVAPPEWADAEVRPLHTGVGYFLFSRLATTGYIGYEEWAYRRGHRNLAPYYLITARRAKAEGM